MSVLVVNCLPHTPGSTKSSSKEQHGPYGSPRPHNDQFHLHVPPHILATCNSNVQAQNSTVTTIGPILVHLRTESSDQLPKGSSLKQCPTKQGHYQMNPLRDTPNLSSSFQGESQCVCGAYGGGGDSSFRKVAKFSPGEF